MTRAGVALLLAVTGAAACSSTGIAVSIEVQPGCPEPTGFALEITATPSGTARPPAITDGKSYFALGAPRFEVIAPEGTTDVAAAVVMLDGASVTGNRAHVAIAGPGVYRTVLTVGGACNGGPPDLADSDASVTTTDGSTDAEPSPDLTLAADLTSALDLPSTTDLTSVHDLAGPSDLRALPDSLVAADLATPDFAMPDLVLPDAARADLSTPPAPDSGVGPLATLSFGVAATQSFPNMSPSDIAIADFNGDGISDVVASMNYSTTVQLLRGTSSGTLASAVTSTYCSTSNCDGTDVAAGDLDGDGRPDIVVANNGAGTVVVLANQTVTRSNSFSFATRASLPFAGAFQLLLADVDGDGHLDVVAANDRQTVAWFRNTSTASGTFSFGPPTSLTTSCQPASGSTRGVVRLAAGDYNGDGLTDLVLACGGHGIDLLLGSAKGFGTPTRLLDDAEIRDVATANLDGAGPVDLVVSGLHTNTDSGFIASLLGATSGLLPPSFNVGVYYPGRLGVGRFFGSATDDVVVMSVHQLIALFPNRGDGTFDTPLFRVGPGFDITGLRPIALGGLSSALDLVVSDNLRGEIAVILDAATKAPTAPFALDATSTGSSRRVAVGDLDGKLGTDLIIADDVVQYYLADASGALGPAQTLSNFQSSSVGVGDIDANGTLDLLLGDLAGGGLAYSLNAGGASFALPRSASSAGGVPGRMGIADFTGAGRASPYVVAWIFDGGGTFLGYHAEAWVAGGGPSFTLRDLGTIATPMLTALDANGDGRVDLIVGKDSSHLLVQVNSGSGTFAPGSTVSTIVGPVLLGSVDVNGDKKLDLVVVGGSPSVLATHLVGNSIGALGATVATASEALALTSADFDRDGVMDIAVLGLGGDVYVHLGNGDGSFKAGLHLTPVGSGADLAAIDVDHDGRVDLAVADSAYDGYVALVLNTSR